MWTSLDLKNIDVWLRRIPIAPRLRLMLTGMLVALVFVTVVAFQSLGRLQVGGPIHKTMVLDQELVADILPPPSYLVEYQLHLHAAYHAKDRNHLEEFRRLCGVAKAEYATRMAYWHTSLKNIPDMYGLLLAESKPPALELFRIAEEQYFPALERGDSAMAQQYLQGALDRAFDQHRAAIVRTANAAQSRWKATRDSAMLTATRTRGLLLSISLLTAGAGFLFVSAVHRTIARPVADLSQVLDEFREGHLDARAKEEGADELTGVARTVNRMVGDISERTSQLSETIGEMTRMYQERNLAQEAMVRTARQAGMAEIATGVLHNVGNVLNSVNIGVDVLRGKIEATKATRVRDVAKLIQDNAGQLGPFFTSDPKGQRLPGYLDKLATSLAEDRDDQLRELRDLTENVSHIKLIIQQQQSFAKLGGMEEPTSLAKLIDDAEKLVNVSAVKNQVTITKIVVDLPDIVVDRQKVMQIVVNLMKNAIEALHDVTDRPRALAVALSRGQHSEPERGELVEIVVKDNGCGIPKEKLNRIFSHGFTTKKTGHGFGLHSCANMAGEMGGSLQVRSDGADCGAVFTLTLPLRQMAPRPRFETHFALETMVVAAEV